MARAPKSSRTRTPTRERESNRGRAALGYTRPRTYEELRAVLSSGTVHFPKRLRQVAIFLWQHPGEVALGTISEVATQAGVQPSTLVRFAQTFGFAGFSEFQDLFKEHIKGSWPDGRARNGGPSPARRGQCRPPLPRRPRRRLAGLACPDRRGLRHGELRAHDGADGRRRPHLRHRFEARLPGHRLCLADAVAAGRPKRARRQCRLHRLRPGRLRRAEGRGAGGELQPLQFDYARNWSPPPASARRRSSRSPTRPSARWSSSATHGSR